MDRDREMTYPSLPPAPISSEEERLSFETLTRLATSSTTPPPPDGEPRMAPALATWRPPVAPGGSRRGLVFGIAIGVLVGGAAAAVAWLPGLLPAGSGAGPEQATLDSPEPQPRIHATPEVAALESPNPRTRIDTSAEAAVGAAVATPALGVDSVRSTVVEPPSALPLEADRGAETKVAPSMARDARPARSSGAADGPVGSTAAEAEGTGVKVADPVGDEVPANGDAPPEVTAEEPPDAPTSLAEPPRPTTLAGLLDTAAPLEEAEPGPNAAAEPEPKRLTPARAEVASALEGLHGEILSCAEGEHGLVELQLTVAASGRVRSALVAGVFAGSAKGSCMARAARSSLRFEPFEEESFAIRYPFRI